MTLSDHGEKARPAAGLRPILHIARILQAHALHGEVKILPLTDDPGRFAGLTECLLLSADEKEQRTVYLDQARISQDKIIIKFRGIDDRNQAENLRGCLLAVEREKAIALPPDSWFICDLVGCSVYDEATGLLGELRDVMQHSAHDVYVVHLEGQADLLFPVLKSILLRVDISARRIDVRLPDGLYEIYRGKKS